MHGPEYWSFFYRIWLKIGLNLSIHFCLSVRRPRIYLVYLGTFCWSIEPVPVVLQVLGISKFFVKERHRYEETLEKGSFKAWRMATWCLLPKHIIFEVSFLYKRVYFQCMVIWKTHIHRTRRLPLWQRNLFGGTFHPRVTLCFADRHEIHKMGLINRWKSLFLHIGSNSFIADHFLVAELEIAASGVHVN